MQNISTLSIAIALFLSSLVLGGSFIYYTNANGQKNHSIQGCFEIARGQNTTQGTGATSTWTVQTPQINSDLLNDCLKRKGY